MSQEWRPSALGRLFAGAPRWRLRLKGESLELAFDGEPQALPLDWMFSFSLLRGLLWTTLTLGTGRPDEVKLGGLRRSAARSLETALAAIAAAQEGRRRRTLFDETNSLINGWLGELARLLQRAQDERRWITHDQQQAALADRPRLPVTVEALRELFCDPLIRAATSQTSEVFEKRLAAWGADWPAIWAAVNERHVRLELVECRELFDRVESTPLTEEQARAAICFDNRVQVVAAAGSGKTSTMIAKAAYAIHRGVAPPERILLLAFNKKAAVELKDRAMRSFARLGWDGMTVKASTFHALGLAVCGNATGRKPDVPDWAADATAGTRKLTAIVAGLRNAQPEFGARWDLFRIVFGRDLPAFSAGRSSDDAPGGGARRQLTIRGEWVRSGEECIIADWLFLHGVDYLYERPYEFDTASETHRQYRPDFYYPDANLYHEHLALDSDGNAPPQFERYLEGVAWKREEHRRRDTALVETTSHGLRTGEAFARLAAALTQRGMILKADPDRPVPKDGQAPLGNLGMVALMRTFISHAKSNALTEEALAERLRLAPEGAFKHRHRLFLDLAGPVMRAWDAALAKEEGIDFEDMLNRAARHLEEGSFEPPWDVVLADEFQDASRARARLCEALVRRPSRHLFVVGDDWQAINRFAGADVSVMTRFRERFGHGQVLRLERTFRCPQELCDASGRFVSRNPNQIAKDVRSETVSHGPVLEAFSVPSRNEVGAAVERYMARLHRRIRDGTVPPGRDGRVSIFVLGRYRADSIYVPRYWEEEYGDLLRVEFLTVHRSKGAEADYVILPGMVEKGFPNLRADDPVLSLAMPDGDAFPLGEERRLFYVALTRARRSVAMFTLAGKTSAFLRELEKDGAVQLVDEALAHREVAAPNVADGGPPTSGSDERAGGPLDRARGRHRAASPPELRAAPSTSLNACVPTVIPHPAKEGVPSSRRAQEVIEERVKEALQAWRREEATRQSVPQYVIFQDRTLAAIASAQPRTLDDLANIPGFGSTKLERYGRGVLNAVQQAH